MENILTLNTQANTLSQEEIETLLKGFIRLIERNTEQKLKNSLQLNQIKNQNNTDYNNIKSQSLPKLNIETVKDLENLKQTALKIFDENKRLKKELKKLELNILKLRSELVKQNEIR